MQVIAENVAWSVTTVWIGLECYNVTTVTYCTSDLETYRYIWATTALVIYRRLHHRLAHVGDFVTPHSPL